ncbi:MAG: hypothetical protein JNM32_04655 [Dechloromonas sp.]|nr:hypothetical protein [Dechloromonas sp.]
MQALLSFDRAPPLAAPLRFLVTAPLFVAALGLLLLFQGSDVFSSRWSPAALAATHLVTVGFFLQVMLGALIQILPVVAGANVPHPLALAVPLHGGLTLGAIALVLAFLAPDPRLYLLAAVLLGASVAGFLVVAGGALFRVPSTSPTIVGLKLAFGGLAGVGGLGVLLLGALAFGADLPLVALTDLHAGWGFSAWVGILLASLAYVVVPMFQLTPGYPASLSRFFPWALFALLLLWSAAVVLDLPVLARFAEGSAALAGIFIAAYTLRLQGKRRRARTDATYRLWQLGLISLLAALALGVADALFPALATLQGWTALFAVLIGVGGYMSLIVGMLYKIVPFLAWLHLRNFSQGKPVPSVSKLLPEGHALAQAGAHGVGVLLLALAALLPDHAARPAGLALLVAALWLEANLVSVLRHYNRVRGEMSTSLRQGP